MKNTKEFLINNCKVFEKEGELWLNGKYKVRPIKYSITTTKHKYGKDMSYEVAILYNYETKKYISYTKQQLLYIWYKGDIPKGYDIDHIDNNPLNNDINNLQLITRAENLRKRKVQSNQYIAAKAKGIKVDNSNRKKYEHSAEFLKKQEKKSAIINMEGQIKENK